MKTTKLRWILLLVAAALAGGCDDKEGLSTTGATTTGTGGAGATATGGTGGTATGGTGGTTGTGTVDPKAACLDRPTDLLRPPAGQLPCELLPPGF